MLYKENWFVSKVVTPLKYFPKAFIKKTYFLEQIKSMSRKYNLKFASNLFQFKNEKGREERYVF